MAHNTSRNTTATDLREELLTLQEELVEASAQNDWPLVQEIDDDIRLLMETAQPEWKETVLAETMFGLKQTYERILDRCRVRRDELNSRMAEMRNKKDALAGYKNSQAAGNRELRASA